MALQQPRVLLLVVVGDVGGGHHHRGLPQRRQLADGGGSGAAQHHVRRRHHHVHVIDILPHVQPRRFGQPPSAELLLHGVPAALAHGVNVAEGIPLTVLPAEEVHHALVHVAGAQASPKGYHKGRLVVKAQLFPRLLPAQAEEVPPHRRPGDGDALRVLIVLAAVLKAHHDDIRVVLQHPRGQAGHHVALVHRRGDVRPGRRLHHGIAGVAAGAHHQVGPEIPQDGPCLTPGGRQHPQGVQVVADARRVQLPLEAADLYGGVVVTRLGHQLPLHARGGAHEQHGGVRVLFLHIARQCDGRVHVSRGAPAGKYHSHSAAPWDRRSGGLTSIFRYGK